MMAMENESNGGSPRAGEKAPTWFPLGRLENSYSFPLFIKNVFRKEEEYFRMILFIAR
jgi:hypothetical protein